MAVWVSNTRVCLVDKRSPGRVIPVSGVGPSVDSTWVTGDSATLTVQGQQQAEESQNARVGNPRCSSAKATRRRLLRCHWRSPAARPSSTVPMQSSDSPYPRRHSRSAEHELGHGASLGQLSENQYRPPCPGHASAHIALVTLDDTAFLVSWPNTVFSTRADSSPRSRSCRQVSHKTQPTCTLPGPACVTLGSQD